MLAAVPLFSPSAGGLGAGWPGPVRPWPWEPDCGGNSTALFPRDRKPTLRLPRRFQHHRRIRPRQRLKPEMGSAIRTLHCITEAELRKQVEDSDQVRDQMRHKMGKCDITVGCGAGG